MHKPASIELGPYQLLERIGEGGSGQVYRARGPAGLVAVKLLGPASDMDDAARARFRREIAALEGLAHPHLVAMIDHGVDAELGPYLVLPLLAGTTLRELVGNRAICPEAALLLIQPIALATAALHAAGYVHRDLKPENVIAGPDGAVTVIDLGLAWREGMTRHTDTGAAVGSVGYMAPEQIEGRTVDTRADVWSLGVMLYEWIAGKRPFARARAAEEAAAMLLGQFPRLTAADRRCQEQLADVVARCLSSDPAKRPTSAELAAAIAAMIDWTDATAGAIASERAAVFADPVGYQARIAAFRVRRMERLAREAIDAGKPFAALAYCDRGLAYSPDHAALLELVAAAEAATANRAPAAATSDATRGAPATSDATHGAPATSDAMRGAPPTSSAPATGNAMRGAPATNSDVMRGAPGDAPRGVAANSDATRGAAAITGDAPRGVAANSDATRGAAAITSDATRGTAANSDARRGAANSDAPTTAVSDAPISAARTAAVATDTRAPVAGAAPSEPTRKRRKVWPWLAAAGLLVWFGAITAYLVVPERKREPAKLQMFPEAATSSMDPKDRELVGGFINLFDRALDHSEGKTAPPSGARPTTAAGWLELAATQQPADAVASIRQALALSPTWLDAQMALCASLAVTKDPGALAACEVALRRRPDDVAMLAAHGAALLQAGEAQRALVDLDRVVAADPDPKWRRLRARARSAAGDKAGAQKDLDHACQLGDAAACSEKP